MISGSLKAYAFTTTLPLSEPQVLGHGLGAVRAELCERARGGHELPANLPEIGLVMVSV